MTVDEAGGTRVWDLADRMARLDTLDVVTELGRMNRTERAVAFRLLSKDRALAVFEDLDPALQAEVLTGLRSESAAEIVAGLDPDDRAGLLDELPASVANALLRGLSPSEREMTSLLLGYPEHAVGRRMSPEVASVSATVTIREAIAHVIELADRVETIYAIAVVGQGREVVGVVSLRRLLVNDPDATVDTVMSPPRMANARDDQESAARLVASSGHVAIPIVDEEHRLLGILTVDDAMRILDEEEAEDDARIGGSTMLLKPYLAVPVLGVVRTGSCGCSFSSSPPR